MPKDRYRFEELAVGPFAALCRVPLTGYRWDAGLRRPPPAEPWENDGRDQGDAPWLVGPAHGEPYDARQYAPLAIPNLHRRFAALQPTPERIKKFADRHGMLGHGTALVAPDTSAQPLRSGESFTFWATEIERMAHLLAVWDLVRRRAAGKLGQLVVWRAASSSSASVSVTWRGQNGALRTVWLARRGVLGDELLARWRPGDVIEPARYYICRAINEQLHGHVSPAVLPFRDGDIFLIPDCLLGAVYVLFALEVSGKQRPAIVCRGCGRYFIPTHGLQHYCDDRCRKRRYYQRHKASGEANHGSTTREG